MPSTPYAKLLVSLNAGPTQSGGVTGSPGDTVQLSAESTAQWDLTTAPRWEIYAFPPGWTGPAVGWTTESVPQPGGGNANIYVYTGLGPPPAFVLPALPMWGKFLFRLTVAGGLLNGLPSAQLVDNSTGLQTIGPNGLLDIAVSEEGQFDTARAWVGPFQTNIRLLDAALIGGTVPYPMVPTSIVIGPGAVGGVNRYAQGDHEHPVTVGAPVDIGLANAAGGGTALAGAAHVHALTFPTTNAVLATANAPITVNGQTVTSGGFIAPYFSTTAASAASAGLVRAANSMVGLAFRNAADSADINAVTVDATDMLTLGSTVAQGVTLQTAAATQINAKVDTAFKVIITNDVISLHQNSDTADAGGGQGVVELRAAAVEPTYASADRALVWAYTGGALKAQNGTKVLSVLAPALDAGVGGEDLRAKDRRCARLQTPDNTPTTALTYALRDDTITRVDVEVVAFTFDGGVCAGYTLKGTIKRFAGGAATFVTGAPSSVAPHEDNAALDATLTVSGNNVLVQVTGLPAVAFEWFVVLDATLMAPTP